MTGKGVRKPGQPMDHPGCGGADARPVGMHPLHSGLADAVPVGGGLREAGDRLEQHPGLPEMVEDQARQGAEVRQRPLQHPAEIAADDLPGEQER